MADEPKPEDAALLESTFAEPPKTLKELSVHEFVPVNPTTAEDWWPCWCGSRHTFF